MEFPEDDTLRALLALRTISGQTRASVERYLDDTRKWQKDYYADAPEDRDAYRRWELSHGTARGLSEDLNNAVQAHWNELIAARAV